MRMLLIYILFVAFGCQQTTFLETENLKTSKSEKVLKIFQVFNFSDSQIQKDSQVFNFSDSKKSSQVLNFSDSQIQKDSQVLSFSASQVLRFSDSQILYYESQIRLADSLYKNYLPQYNFDEVKAAVGFFDSLRLTTVNSQQTTDFLETENLEISETEKGLRANNKGLKANDKGLKSESRKDAKSQSDCLYDPATL